MKKLNASSPLVFLAASFVAAAICLFFLFYGNGPSNQAREDEGGKTETIAAAAGAKVTPTEPKLRVEPK